MAKLTHEDILAYLEEATILELNDLVKAIEEKFDVTAAAPVAVAAAADAGAAAEPTEVNVTLTEVGGTKVAVIKAVREITGLGLVDAKGLVDKAPSVIKEKVSADEAKEIKETVAAEKAANLPQAMIENIAKGRLGKFLKEVCLLNQESIMDPKKTVSEVLKAADPELAITEFKRFTLRAE